MSPEKKARYKRLYDTEVKWVCGGGKGTKAANQKRARAHVVRLEKLRILSGSK